MKSVEITALSEFLADETAYPSQNGHRDPGSPSWIFSDSHVERDELTGYVRDIALDFEEWVAGKNHEEALRSGKERLARIVKTRVETKPSGQHSLIGDHKKELIGHVPIPSPSKRDIKRREWLVRRTEGSLGTSIWVDDDYNPEDDSPEAYSIVTYKAGYSPFDPLVVQGKREAKVESSRKATFEDMMEIESQNKWLTNFYRHRPGNNDHLHRIVASILPQLEEADLDEVYQNGLMQGIKTKVKFAPGPISGTVFRNVDGTRYETAGKDFIRAKKAFIEAQAARGHELTDELVSVDRVQYVGERRSKLIVGVRRNSAETASNYYDPNPSWKEPSLKDSPGNYLCGANNLIRINRETKVMPSGAYRLTVREVERCLIAGAETFENDVEAYASSLEEPYLSDGRIRIVNLGYGSEGRDQSDMSHEEAYLYGVFQSLGAASDDPFYVMACDLISLADQQYGALTDHFRGMKGQRCEQYYDVIDTIKSDMSLDGAETNEMLAFAKSAMNADEDGNSGSEGEILVGSDATAAFDDEYNSWEIPGENGSSRIGLFRHWK